MVALLLVCTLKFILPKIKQSFSESPVKSTQPKDKKAAMVLLSIFVSSGNVPNRRNKEIEKVSLCQYISSHNNQPKFSYGLPLLWGGTLSSCPLYAASEISSKLIILIHLGLTQISSCHCFQISVIIHIVRL